MELQGWGEWDRVVHVHTSLSRNLIKTTIEIFINISIGVYGRIAINLINRNLVACSEENKRR